MANELLVAIKLSADGSQLKAEVQGIGRNLKELGASAQQGGNQGSAGMRRLTEEAGKAEPAAKRTAAAIKELHASSGSADSVLQDLGTALRSLQGGFGSLTSVVSRFKTGFAAIVAGAGIKEFLEAGDAMANSIARLGSATGNLTTASEIYDRLYKASLRTGASIDDSVGAFTRFSVAARDIGATNDQVLKLIEGIQGFGRLAGTSSAEMSAATLQLGQALASGTLQGDELRSVLEAMPQLAQALAGQLNMSVGELRKAGAEGRLTADQVFPALLRASEGVQQQLQGLPTTLKQGTDILTAAMGRFLAQLDQAVGTSRTLASTLAAAGRGLDAARIQAGLSSESELYDENARVIREAQARRENLLQPGTELIGQAEAARERLAKIAEIDAQIERLQQQNDEIDRDRASRRLTEQAEADRRAADQRRAAGQAAYNELREQTDKEYKLRQEYAARSALLQRAVQGGAISQDEYIAQSVRLQAQLQKSIDDLNKPDGHSSEAIRSNDALAVARIRRLRDEAQQFERTVDPLKAYAFEVDRLNQLHREGGLSQAAYDAGLQRAAETLNRAGEAADSTTTGIQGLDSALDALNENLVQTGRETSDYLAKATLGLDGVRFSIDQLIGKLASGVLSRLIQDEIIGPLTRVLLTMAKAGLTSIGYDLGFTSPTPNSKVPIDTNPVKVGTSHTGGIAGVDAHQGFRFVDPEIFRAAPRHHGGMPWLMPNERPVVVEDKEGIFTPAQMKAMGPAGGTTVVNVIDQRSASSPAAEVSETRGPNGARQISILLRGEMRSAIADGSMDGVMRGAYGVQRRGA